MTGVSVSLLSLFLMISFSKDLSNIEIAILYAVYYGGYGMSFSSLMTSGLTSLEKKDHAQGNAIFNTLQQFSGALGTA
ncbi:hypothetical protein FC93_GL000704 [Lactobacillus kefiranofaciens subsp. kefiranofaciens DSM 5016 = JCM 6985]|nr:hypothetical protein FC93_GL000704 [Lactobacillus kefiranofaciens subsp. kefiranofaciens DSM 5016 = JCM 6985]